MISLSSLNIICQSHISNFLVLKVTFYRIRIDFKQHCLRFHFRKKVAGHEEF